MIIKWFLIGLLLFGIVNVSSATSSAADICKQLTFKNGYVNYCINNLTKEPDRAEFVVNQSVTKG